MIDAEDSGCVRPAICIRGGKKFFPRKTVFGISIPFFVSDSEKYVF
ncbi:MAG: hypothetical protein FWE78_00740 [Methanimicrococcus sp.]|nr:hypothetical protein [Methanimicrococcus sp.]